MNKYLNTLIFPLFILLINLALGQAPTANFNASPTSVCLGQTVTFTNTSSANGSPISSFAWNFGDGNTSSLANPTHTYTAAGTYTITLIATSQGGQADPEVKSNYITVNPLPNASFTVAGNGCTVPFTVNFTNTSSTGGYSYAWAFGNGQTSNLQNPGAVTYTSGGTFNVSLTVTNTSTGCVKTFTQPLNVSNFNAAMTIPSSACVGQPVSFTNASTIGSNSWNWNFGDLQTSTSQNPSHVYSTPGTYTVSLTAQNTTSGCSAVAPTQSITIHPLPTATINATPTTGCAPLSVSFSTPTVAGSTYSWSFGNGSTGTGANPANQTYSTNGVYSVALTVTNSFGCVNVITQNNLITVSPPVALFTSNVINGCAPLGVQFTSTSTTPNPINNPITSWVWNYGDGTPNYTGQNPPVHNYAVGVYSPTLTITTQNGCVSTITIPNMISVGSIQSASFVVAPTIQCAKTPVQFTSTVVYNGTPNPGEITYAWQFGDGGTSTLPNPSHPYASDTGYMNVQLVVSWRGCDFTTQLPNAVYIKAPISNFTPSSILFCNPTSLPVTLNVTDNAINGRLSDDVEILWKWGDGTTTLLDDPQVDDADLGSSSHNYSAYGTYAVWQVIYNHTTGCSDSTNQTIYVSRTIADFTYSNDSVCVNTPLALVSTSTSTHPWGVFNYTMGDGGTTNGIPATYTYNTFGTYDITLTAINLVGCAATHTYLGMDVLALPTAGINPSATTGCVPITVTYNNTSFVNNNGVPLNTFGWLFPNGSTTTTNSTATTTSYSFGTEGNFTTQLIAVDNFGCISAPTSVNMFITKPEALFSVDSIICNLESFATTNTSIDAISYQWVLDGTPISTQQNYSGSFNNSSTNNSVNHLLSLIATDINGCHDTLNKDIIVSLPIADFGITLSGANINGSGNFTCPPVFGDFTNESDSYGAITNYNWSFDTGISSTLENPGNTYVFAGTYDLGLTITDEYGCTDDTLLVDFLTIGGPTGTPQWSSIGDVCGEQFDFFATDLNLVTQIIWNMDDGTILDTMPSFSYTFGQYTTYQPTATLIDSLGCEIIYQLPDLQVIPNGLNAGLVATPESGSIGTTFTFTDNSTSTNGQIVNYSLIISGDTIPYTNSFTYLQQMGPTGTYPVTLIITDINGCMDEVTINILVDNNFTLPNVISANGDGVNDLFVLPAEIFKTFDIYILNRWGELVHKAIGTSGILMWDGFTDGGNKSPDGVYFYKLVGTFTDFTTIEKEGFVTVTASN